MPRVFLSLFDAHSSCRPLPPLFIARQVHTNDTNGYETFLVNDTVMEVCLAFVAPPGILGRGGAAVWTKSAAPVCRPPGQARASALVDVSMGTARKCDGISDFEEDTDAEVGEEGEVQPGEMDTGNWTALDTQVPFSTDTRWATQGQGHWVHGGCAGEEGPRVQGNLTRMQPK